MNKRIDIEQIANTVDFENVSRKLETFAESGQLQRRKTIHALLDKVRPALLLAREKKATFGALAAFLKENGIPVSETVLRDYLNAQTNAKKSRKRRQPANAPKPAIAPTPAPTASSPEKRLPPRLAKRV